MDSVYYSTGTLKHDASVQSEASKHKAPFQVENHQEGLDCEGDGLSQLPYQTI